MNFITLERSDIFSEYRPAGTGDIATKLIKQQPITINPQYIVSMLECFDSSKEFEFTEIYLSNGTYYHVTSRIDEIVDMIRKG